MPLTLPITIVHVCTTQITGEGHVEQGEGIYTHVTLVVINALQIIFAFTLRRLREFDLR